MENKANITSISIEKNKIGIKLSIIVPVYNIIQYLPKCLDSILSQTLRDIEIICVDDCSTDSSFSILEEYKSKDDRIKLLKLAKNYGQGYARNRGIEIAQGEYIGFVDGDDYIDPNYFEALYNSAVKNNADISVASILKHKKNYKKYNVIYKKEGIAENIQDKIKLCGDKKKFFFYAWNKIYKTDLIKNNGIEFAQGQIYEDVIFAIEALYYSNRVVSVPNIKYHYIERKNSSVKRKDITGKKEYDLTKAYTELQDFCHEHNIILPERLNYSTKKKFGLITKYQGKFCCKYTLLGILPLFKIYSTETRNIFNIYGVKIKLPKKEFVQARKENDFYKYKKNKIDITTIPKATGKLRDIQLANLALLKELDYVCKQNKINYILDAGTLLGAIRHKGFIPWDDDVDIIMIRDDYNRIIEAFKETSRNSDIFADFYRDNVTNGQYFIKVQHRKCPFLSVDIFPIDDYGVSLTLKDQIHETKKIYKLIKSIKHTANQGLSNAELKHLIDETMVSKILPKDQIQQDIKPYFVYGIDSFHILKNWFVKRDTILPLRTINFENYEFTTVNNPDEFLRHIYGNYMTYPHKMKLLHSSYESISKEQWDVIRELKRGV